MYHKSWLVTFGVLVLLVVFGFWHSETDFESFMFVSFQECRVHEKPLKAHLEASFL